MPTTRGTDGPTTTLQPEQAHSQGAQSYASDYSTAPLPKRYAITRGYAAPPTEEEEDAARVEGAEAISDAMLAHKERARVLPRSRGLWAYGHDHRRKEAQQPERTDAKFLTATFAVPCTCSLPRWPHARAGPSAPLNSDLEPLEDHPEPDQIPRLGDELRQWVPWPNAVRVDLDAALGELRDFEHEILPDTWREIGAPRGRDKGKGRAVQPRELDPNVPPSRIDKGKGRAEPPAADQTPAPPRIDKGKKRAAEPLESVVDFARRRIDMANGRAEPLVVETSALGSKDKGKHRAAEPSESDVDTPPRRIDKGKGRAVEPDRVLHVPPSSAPTGSTLPPSSFPASSTPQRHAPSSEPQPHVHSSSLLVPETPDAQAHEETASPASIGDEERRAWWRAEIAHGKGYAQFFSCFTRDDYPALHEQRRKRRKPNKRDDFKLARNLAAIEHPFHPDLHYYMSHSGSRVYWLIPINGPVIIPGCRDPITELNPGNPYPSRGDFANDSRGIQDIIARLEAAKDAPKPRPLCWSPCLVRAFVKHRFELMQASPECRFGWISLQFSGPKPEPFRNAEPRPPLDAHEYVPDGVKAKKPPVRPEAGDHLRIYCDARFALNVRSWLKWWNVSAETLQSCLHFERGRGSVGPARELPTPETTPTPDPQEVLTPFENARFALVGHRGETLMVV